ncbi:hypothetical protein NE237_024206 [Protea cynaroides]|uniref:RING-type E3 ubiquitin transferase n=1 Tax=Protea cynaroides TaxID=273540 RepID=A0A9Q0HDA7_9MAGN|nr:hypothetical protein NE237_024206 [Protea cynaroides]
MAVSCAIDSCTPTANGRVVCSFYDCRKIATVSPPPPPPPTSHGSAQTFSPALLIVFAVLGGAFLLVTYYAVIVKYRASWNRSRNIQPDPDNGQEDFLDEDHGPVVDHPIWFIQTVGLPENIVNSIAVCKYQKGEGLVEGTECSVCLGEFQEDETLRLLPKCSHAFHLPCIDTWLKSHTNCPVCRAPVVSNVSGTGLSLTATEEPSSSNLDTVDETQLGNSSRDVASGSNLSGEDGVDSDTEDEVWVDVRTGDTESEKEAMTVLSSPAKSGDLGDDRLEEGKIQPVRRSFSMGSFAAAMICFSLANFPPSESEGSSSIHLVPVKESNLEDGSPNIFKLMSGSFNRRALKAGPVAMKRSVSCGGKFLLSRYGGTKNSILPL